MATDTRDNVTEELEVSEQSFQGPVNWRKNLKPIPSPLIENKEFVSKDGMSADDKANENKPESENNSPPPSDRPCLKDAKKLTKAELEDSRIRERLKNMPNTAKSKEKGPLLAKPLTSTASNLVPQASSIFRTRSFQENPTVGGLRKAAILRSGSFHETPFTRNVVNRPLSPGIPRRRISPSNSFTKGNLASGRRTPSPNMAADTGDTAKKRVDKVLRARLYLLQQMGPNSFLIGGDNPDNKYKVIIGPQTCSCCRPHCVHLLFIMLRVFQVRENDALLWSKPLKNYEVENLFRLYHARRTSRIKSLKKAATSVAKPSSPPPSPSSPDSVASNNSDVGRTEEETCPICLMELLDGEATVACEGGCQNKLHLHCIAVWFQLCRKQHDTLICPLCRMAWKGNMAEINAEPVDSPMSTPEPDMHPDSRASSPQPVSTGTENLLPRPEPIPAEFQDISRPWLELLSEDLVSCLVSRNWSVRETGLRHLAREVIASLLPTVGEGRQGVNVSVDRQEMAKRTLACCCSVLAFTCSDPVYKVFVASLRALRSVLSYTPCRDSNKQSVLQSLLKPVIDAVLLKCADGNRRTSQLSTSTILELAKGQEGELAVGREITNPGADGLGGVTYVLSCVTEDYEVKDVQWQWLLGRIHTIDKLVEEFQHEFLVDVDSQGGDIDIEKYDDMTSYQKVMSVLKFSLKALDHSHTRIGKTARRVFIRTARFVVHIPKLFRKVEDMLNCLDATLQSRMKHRLLLILSEYQGQGEEPSATSSPIPVPTPVGALPYSPRGVESIRNSESPRNTIIINNYVTDKVVVVRPDGKHGFTPVSLASSVTRDMQRSESPRDDGTVSPRSKARRPNTLVPPQKRLHWKSAFAMATNQSEHLLVPQPPPDPVVEGDDEEELVDSAKEPVCRESSGGSSMGSLEEETVEKSATESTEKETLKETVESEDPPVEEVCGPAVRTSIHFSDDFLVTSHIGANGEVTTYTSQSTNTTPTHTTVYSDNVRAPRVLPPKPMSYADKSKAPLPPDPKEYTPLPPLPVVQVSDANGDMIDSPDEPFPHQLSRETSIDEVDEGFKIENEPSFYFLRNPPGLLKRKAIYCSCGGNDGCLNCEQMWRSMLADSSVEYESETCDTQTEAMSDDDNDIREELTFTDDDLSDQVSAGQSESSTPAVEPHCRSSSSREYLETNLDDISVDERSMSVARVSTSTPSAVRVVGQASGGCKTQDSGMVTEDFSDLTLSPSTPDDAVSFKSEVAVLSPRNGEPEEDNCHCKEEVELEEAVALAKAMEISEKQDALPIVPGLRGCHAGGDGEEEKTLVIQVQKEDGSTDGHAPKEYKENKQWVRGEMIGTGAFSTCYQARDVQTGVLMAVKQISFCRNSKTEQQKVVEAVSDEIQMMARLNHPNIVRILGATQQGYHFNMFVEWMPGGSVAYLLDKFGAFSEPVITSYTQQVLIGLSYLHEHHKLHRDLKGANILVDSTGKRIRIADFGTAARLGSHQTGAGEFQGQMLGTIAFMAPEVLRGESYGRSCDIWSVGCCMIEMHTTKPPWGASDVSNHLKLMYKIASAKDPPPIPDGMSPAVKDLLLRCVEVNREHRPSAKELLQHPLFTRYRLKPK